MLSRQKHFEIGSTTKAFIALAAVIKAVMMSKPTSKLRKKFELLDLH